MNIQICNIDNPEQNKIVPCFLIPTVESFIYLDETVFGKNYECVVKRFIYYISAEGEKCPVVVVKIIREINT